MPRIDFYVLSDTAPEARLKTACRIVEKAYGAGQKVYIRTAGEADSQAIDNLLWTYSDQSFVPHEIAAGGPVSHDRIAALIGTGPAPAPYRQVLVNLTDIMPTESDSVERIVEIVDADPERKRLARDRFRTYRERGCVLETHNL